MQKYGKIKENKANVCYICYICCICDDNRTFL